MCTTFYLLAYLLNAKSSMNKVTTENKLDTLNQETKRGTRDFSNTFQTFGVIEIIGTYRNKNTINMEVPYFGGGEGRAAFPANLSL